MEHYAGLDVSLELTSVCIVDAQGRIVHETRVASDPEDLVRYFQSLKLSIERAGLEAGPLSQWLHAGLVDAGFETVLSKVGDRIVRTALYEAASVMLTRTVRMSPLKSWAMAVAKRRGTKKARVALSLLMRSRWPLETRHVKAALSAMKTDRRDARGIAQPLRLGWYRPVHAKSASAQEVRSLLTARKLIQAKLLDIESGIRGLLRGFGAEGRPDQPRALRGPHPRAGCRPADARDDVRCNA